MSSTSVALRPMRRSRPRLRTARPNERSGRRGVYLAWSLLALNVLTFYPMTWTGAPLAVPIPSKVGKIITQGALVAAIITVLIINRRLRIRPNIFLCLAGLLAVDAVLASMQSDHFLGTGYRTARLVGFVIVLWLLSPWWGRRDLLLVRSHLTFSAIVLGTVIFGFIVEPSKAMAGGRLGGVFWPVPPTGIAHFAAVTFGIVVVLWFGGRVSGRLALFVVAVTTAIILLSHTRTALLAMTIGLLVASLSLFTVKARVRKLLVTAAIAIAICALTLSSAITNWLARGQSSQELTSFTGRTTVWTAILSAPRPEVQLIFGSGLSNLSFNGLPIDSNWLGAYLDLGLVGVVISATMLLFPLVNACFQARGVERALGLFLISYCIVSSFTETGLSGSSEYLLDLTLAASLLAPAARERVASPAIGERMPRSLGRDDELITVRGHHLDRSLE